MPSRQISPQSFDEILSELGDDPAIPDPHGIRKSNSPKSPYLNEGGKANPSPKIEAFSLSPRLEGLKKWLPFLGMGLALAIAVVGLMSGFDAMKSSQESDFEASRKQIAELQKDLGLLREEMLEIENSVYESLDSLEVSVHSLKENKPAPLAKAKPQAIPFESELRRWRYLGLSQMGASQRAFFDNGKRTVMAEKGAILLGDWRLGNLDLEAATVIHPQGKTLILKTNKTE